MNILALVEALSATAPIAYHYRKAEALNGRNPSLTELWLNRLSHHSKPALADETRNDKTPFINTNSSQCGAPRRMK
jgi:hypothetical protein